MDIAGFYLLSPIISNFPALFNKKVIQYICIHNTFVKKGVFNYTTVTRVKRNSLVENQPLLSQQTEQVKRSKSVLKHHTVSYRKRRKKQFSGKPTSTSSLVQD